VAPPDGYQPSHAPATAHDNPAHERLRQALFDMEAAGNNFAMRFIREDAVRQQYRRSIQAAVHEITADVDSHRITAEAGAERAVRTRNALMDLQRSRSSEVGRAAAEALKKEGKTFEELVIHRANKLFGKAPEALSAAERTAVMRAVIEGAARDNAGVTMTLRVLGSAGRGLVALSVGLAVYEIYRAPDWKEETLHQGVLAGAGIGGGYLAGAIGGSLVCGPAAPVCAGVFVLVGGVVFTLGADYGWNRLNGAQ
jgi:hypothetical protein